MTGLVEYDSDEQILRFENLNLLNLASTTAPSTLEDLVDAVVSASCDPKADPSPSTTAFLRSELLSAYRNPRDTATRVLLTPQRTNRVLSEVPYISLKVKRTGGCVIVEHADISHINEQRRRRREEAMRARNRRGRGSFLITSNSLCTVSVPRDNSIRRSSCSGLPEAQPKPYRNRSMSLPQSLDAVVECATPCVEPMIDLKPTTDLPGSPLAAQNLLRPAREAMPSSPEPAPHSAQINAANGQINAANGLEPRVELRPTNDLPGSPLAARILLRPAHSMPSPPGPASWAQINAANGLEPRVDLKRPALSMPSSPGPAPHWAHINPANGLDVNSPRYPRGPFSPAITPRGNPTSDFPSPKTRYPRCSFSPMTPRGNPTIDFPSPKPERMSCEPEGLPPLLNLASAFTLHRRRMASSRNGGGTQP
eukprot:CAMPEP_0114552380 /NCGR_PEP_ID=MMETSP0114-20121206/7095_1 /TAXON_ID=31324 /ORGANISM="Goniomonas sp, Strain m" /LENGTH=423 /DNA_ID=CAMNT_0001737255 /DNA_START=15 /DNA_END=1283 /DNA_ORIENTATION=+